MSTHSGHDFAGDLEQYPGQVEYQTKALRKLRRTVGEVIDSQRRRLGARWLYSRDRGDK